MFSEYPVFIDSMSRQCSTECNCWDFSKSPLLKYLWSLSKIWNTVSLKAIEVIFPLKIPTDNSFIFWCNWGDVHVFQQLKITWKLNIKFHYKKNYPNILNPPLHQWTITFLMNDLQQSANLPRSFLIVHLAEFKLPRSCLFFEESQQMRKLRTEKRARSSRNASLLN